METRGGTAEAPNNLPLGVQPLGGLNNGAVHNAPIGSSGGLVGPGGYVAGFQPAPGQQAGSGFDPAGWGLGGLQVGSPSSAGAMKGASNWWGSGQPAPGQQAFGAPDPAGTGYGGANLASVCVDPTIGPDGC